jgi:hypothetical protein
VNLTTPNPDDGAILVELRGPVIQSVTEGVSEFRVYSDTLSATVLRAFVVGGLSSGGLLTVQVPDVGAATSYSATVLEVADRENVVRSDLAGYVLEIAR